ncbi:hypothetical protein E2C01_059203 [Portunus trituberculatus]|uniref:Uncharacterized protein n=1 Tax=Portunus trituberculatus TaxID=210409 RepID=A0A5B7H6X8_PORTR|nr:hypothetical protein [Portunus trituberculatus]
MEERPRCSPEEVKQQQQQQLRGPRTVSRRGAPGGLSRRRGPAERHNGCHRARHTILPARDYRSHPRPPTPSRAPPLLGHACPALELTRHGETQVEERDDSGERSGGRR